MTTVLVTGGFDPLHSGHIKYFENAAKLGDRLVVGLNSDEWLTRKKGRPFMFFEERKFIISNLQMVDDVISFDDADDTANHAIFQVMSTCSDKIIFANGGDRTAWRTPEIELYENHPRVEFKFDIGGGKINSSSWLLLNWKAPKVNRSWGYYRELYRGTDFQVKELVIKPQGSLTMQRHEHRSETWNIVHGAAKIRLNKPYVSDPHQGCNILTLHNANPIDVPAGTWHQGFNDTDKPAHIIEIWKGKTDLLVEDDIERYE